MVALRSQAADLRTSAKRNFYTHYGAVDKPFRQAMRYFNTHGPVNVEEHYVVPRQEFVDQLVTQIERGTYFTIFAPRQMGKTTLLYSAAAHSNIFTPVQNVTLWRSLVYIHLLTKCNKSQITYRWR